ncbi:MAG TPA: C4-dicarboxylic acid transporter DauA [Kofleriaceae bacterium]|nr:C4-dicarboxylic acid transporter DauA [Kofleriaceae bacterium]
MKRYVDELTDVVRSQLALVAGVKDQLAYGLRARMREGYTRHDFRADVLAGLVVGIVALPLSMALAIATEVPPQHGLYTAIVAGIICALLGGTRLQVTGPTAAFVVILVPIVRQFGVAGLLVAGMMAGIILLLMGIARLGRLMQFIPHPVTSGFTMGIAVVIGVGQLKDVMGVSLVGADGSKPDGTIETIGRLFQVAGHTNGWDVLIAVVTLALLLGIPRIIKRIPAPLIALTLAAVLAVVLEKLIGGFHAATIGSKFTSTIDGETIRGIPPLPPLPMLPWDLHDTLHKVSDFHLDYATIKALLPSAFAIAMLGAIESLMAAVVADGMSGTKHDPNAELIALGIGNIIVPFFGGIAATGAIARTATNIRAGGRSPISVIVHSVFVLACTIALAPLVAYLPMAAMAALLLIVARNMSEARHFVRLVRIAPRADVMVLLACFGLTVVFDMVIAVSVGVVLAALLFMRRMAVMTRIELDTETSTTYEAPPGVRIYEIAGPMFFGAAKTAMETLDTVGSETRTLILAMEHVPVMDATGMVALETMLDRLHRSNRKVIIAGLQPEPTEVLARAGIKRIPGRLAFAPDIETALSMAIVHEARQTPPAGVQLS